MTKKSKGKKPGGKQARSRSVGPKLVTKRHARDGSVVPVDDKKMGRTLSEEWVAKDGDLGDWEPAKLNGPQDLYEALIHTEPPRGAVSLDEMYFWSGTVLRENGYPEPETPENGELPLPWKLPTRALEAHSQLMLASQCMRAVETVRYAYHTNQPRAAADQAALAADRYHLARRKREDEKETLAGSKCTIGGDESKRGESPLRQEALDEAKKRWKTNPEINTSQMARNLGRMPIFKIKSMRTIRGWISDLNPSRTKNS